MILFWQRNSKEFVEFYLLMITEYNVDHPFSYGKHCLNGLGNLRISWTALFGCMLMIIIYARAICAILGGFAECISLFVNLRTICILLLS